MSIKGFQFLETFACTVGDGAGAGRGRRCRGRQCADVFQLFVKFDRTPLHTARRQAVLHTVLRAAVRQQVRGMQTGHRNRLQGSTLSYTALVAV